VGEIMPHSKIFKELLKNVETEYTGKKVPEKYKSKYGKAYDKKEAKSIAYAIAKSKGIKIDK
jgi:hypothetical protein